MTELLLRTVKFHCSKCSWFHSFIVTFCARRESVCETARVCALCKHVALGFGAAFDGMQYLYTPGKFCVCHCVLLCVYGVNVKSLYDKLCDLLQIAFITAIKFLSIVKNPAD